MWTGRGAALIGLAGEVGRRGLAVLFGRFVVPSTAGGVRLPSGRCRWTRAGARTHGRQYVRDGSVAEPIVALDVTCSPSKIVSVLWGLTGDEQVRRIVLEAHEAAVAAGLAYLDETVDTVEVPRGGVVIVDEASMVATLVLDEMVRVAGVYGSKITLIGDFAEIGAPEAGGLLRDLAVLPAAVELPTAVRRFRQPWESDASLQLRARQPDIAATYWQEGRIVESRLNRPDASMALIVDRAEPERWSNRECQESRLRGEIGTRRCVAAGIVIVGAADAMRHLLSSVLDFEALAGRVRAVAGPLGVFDAAKVAAVLEHVAQRTDAS